MEGTQFGESDGSADDDPATSQSPPPIYYAPEDLPPDPAPVHTSWMEPVEPVPAPIVPDPAPSRPVRRGPSRLAVGLSLLFFAVPIVWLITLLMRDDGGPDPTTSGPPPPASVAPVAPGLDPADDPARALSDTATCVAQPGPSALLTGISTGRHPTFDRIVLRFDGPVPDCKASFVDQITADGSGAPIPLGGNAFLSITNMGATSWDGTQRTYTGSQSFSTPELDNVEAVVISGDFEGYLTIGVGMRQRTHYEVFALTDPTRVVIDVAH